jgi:hypothetical protein
LATEGEGLIGICAESLAEELGYRPADGTILLTSKASFVTPPLTWQQVPFSAGLIVASYGQEARLGYADRGKWTGKPIPQPTECPKLANVPTQSRTLRLHARLQRSAQR